jgi:hypothetical protein
VHLGGSIEVNMKNLKIKKAVADTLKQVGIYTDIDEFLGNFNE